MNQAPHNIEIEQALVGALFVDNTKLDAVAGFLDGEHFYEPQNAEIYGAVRRLWEERRPFTPVTLAPLFEHAEPVGGLTVAQYMGKLAASVPSLRGAPEYGRMVKELADRRALAETGARLQQ